MPPPPPIICNYTIEETLKKAHSLTQAFLAKTRKLAAFRRPLNRQKSAVPIFFRKPRRFFRAALGSCLPSLLLASALSLTHCSSDDNGGGSGGGDDPTDPSSPSLSAIYIWRTECHVQGNIEGSGSAINGVPPCDTSALTGTGRAKAKQLCEARFTAVLADGIQDEPSDAALRHEPLLAVDGIDGSSPANRQAFIPGGDVTKAVKIPSNGRGLASSWEAFLDPSMPIDHAIPRGAGTAGVNHYTGLNSSFALDTTRNCDDWGSDADSKNVKHGYPSGSYSDPSLPFGAERLSANLSLHRCSHNLEILCITY